MIMVPVVVVVVVQTGIILLCGIIPNSFTASSWILQNNKQQPVSLPFVTTGSDLILAWILYRYFLSSPSIVPFWRPITSIVSQYWYTCLEWIFCFSFLRLVQPQDSSSPPPTSTTTATSSSNLFSVWKLWIRTQIVDGGPLGRGLKKLVEVMVATILWKTIHGTLPNIQAWGPIPTSIYIWTLLAIICIGVNAVLYLWSYLTQSRGQHVGVTNMVSNTTNRSLSITEHFQYAILALSNAYCEEVTSRWFWWNEFGNTVCSGDWCTSFDDRGQYSNILQATLFGIWHYYGIPSGWIGVGLTFVYGYIMGILKVYGNDGGLFLPICAHAIADYYLFTTIARGKATKKNDA